MVILKYLKNKLCFLMVILFLDDEPFLLFVLNIIMKLFYMQLRFLILFLFLV